MHISLQHTMMELPPPPTKLPTPPTFVESPPLVVLPGDDLTRFILRDEIPPTSIDFTASPRKNKKKKNTAGAGGDDDDHTIQPPKVGTGLVIICENNNSSDRPDNVNSSGICILATIAGRLVYRASSRTWFVASNPKRYHPTRSPLSSASVARITSGGSQGGIASNVGIGDRVIGIIEDQRASADYYRVNIFGSHSALLHVLSFEGATKRNRPQLDPGSLIYCRVVKGFGGGRMDPEVSCTVGGGGGGKDAGKSTYNCDENDYEEHDDGGAARKDWMTTEGTYGALVGGTSFRIPLGLARELLLPKNAVLDALDKAGMTFEIVIGVNGVVWVNSPEPLITIMIVNAIKNSEVMAEELVRGMVKAMVKNVKKELDE